MATATAAIAIADCAAHKFTMATFRPYVVDGSLSVIFDNIIYTVCLDQRHYIEWFATQTSCCSIAVNFEFQQPRPIRHTNNLAIIQNFTKL